MFSQGYVGFTSKTVLDRWSRHKELSTASQRFEYPLYRAIRKYGDSLIIETLVAGDDTYCLEVEFKLRPDKEIGWNIVCGGGAPMLGLRHSAEARRKMSESHSGEKHHLFGKKMSSSSRAKMSLAKEGKCDDWKGNQSGTVWTIAEFLFSYFQENPTHGAVRMGRTFDLSYNQTKTILKKLRSGWIPAEDEEYQLWLTEYKQKDTNASSLAPTA